MATLKVEVDPARDHIAGAENALVTLVEYGDYECPHCARAVPVVDAVRQAMGNDLRYVFRHFPLSEMHPNAQSAAEVAEAAGAQGKFWETHQAIYAHQREGLSEEHLLAWAGDTGVDPAKVREALQNGTYAERVREDFLSGIRSGVNGTPTFFINGTRHDDSWDQETLLEALQAAQG